MLILLKDFKKLDKQNGYIQQCYYCIKIILRTNSKHLDEYIMNDSDLIEIIMAKLTAFYRFLPERVTKKKQRLVFKKSKIRKAKKNKEETKETKEKTGIKLKKISYTNSTAEVVGIRDMLAEVFSENSASQQINHGKFTLYKNNPCFNPAVIIDEYDQKEPVEGWDVIQNFDTFSSFYLFFNEVVQ